MLTSLLVLWVAGLCTLRFDRRARSRTLEQRDDALEALLQLLTAEGRELLERQRMKP